MRKEVYNYILDELELYKPVQWKFSWLSIRDTLLSKRTIKKYIRGESSGEENSQDNTREDNRDITNNNNNTNRDTKEENTNQTHSQVGMTLDSSL